MLPETEEQIIIAMNFEKERKFSKAKRLYNNILKYDPQNIIVLRNLALLESSSGHCTKALELMANVIELAPKSDSYVDLGRVYIDKNDFFNAIENCKKAIMMDFNNYDAWFYLAYALKKNNQIDDAIIAYNKALELNPDSSSVYHNLGNIYKNNKNDPQTAIMYYKKYIKYHPEDTDAKSSLGTLYLKTKNYKAGWKYLEYCINKAKAMEDIDFILNSPKYKNTLWNSEDIKDKTIFTFYDGGLGDTIMFARYFPLLKEKCAKILFGSQTPLIKLLKDSGLDIEILDKNLLEKDLKFDVHCPIMSLPYKLHLNHEEDIPSPEGYIKADPQKVEEYRKKYFDNDKFKIGIKWKGNTLYNQTRHIKLKSFYKLFDLPNTQFYTLQRDEGAEELELAKDYNLVDLGKTFEDFSDTAAAVENADLIICNDTSVAHLAGALGKKCWVLLPFEQDWRWTTDINDCKWYKSIRLFKQNKIDDWDELFERVYKELDTEIKAD